MRDVARARGWRSALFCPLTRDKTAIGMISVTRREPGRFSRHQIQLLETFADQAVIAIENVRLFNETRRRSTRRSRRHPAGDQPVRRRYRTGVRKDPDQCPAYSEHKFCEYRTDR